MCTNFEQNRPTFISKSAPVSQAEALKFSFNLVKDSHVLNVVGLGTHLDC